MTSMLTKCGIPTWDTSSIQVGTYSPNETNENYPVDGAAGFDQSSNDWKMALMERYPNAGGKQGKISPNPRSRPCVSSDKDHWYEDRGQREVVGRNGSSERRYEDRQDYRMR